MAIDGCQFYYSKLEVGLYPYFMINYLHLSKLPKIHSSSQKHRRMQRRKSHLKNKKNFTVGFFFMPTANTCQNNAYGITICAFRMNISKAAAENICKSTRSGVLLEIFSEEMTTFVTDKLFAPEDSTKYFWIGLSVSWNYEFVSGLYVNKQMLYLNVMQECRKLLRVQL